MWRFLLSSPSPTTMRRPPMFPLLVAALAASASAASTPPRELARALLLNKSIWIYGGLNTVNATARNLLAQLDVSQSWNTGNPPYSDHSADGLGVAPNTQYGTLFPSADQMSFYSFDAYGPNSTYTFAKYDTVAHTWTVIPTTSTKDIVLPNAGPAAFDNSGNTWVWGGIATNDTYDPNGPRFPVRPQFPNLEQEYSAFLDRSAQLAHRKPAAVSFVSPDFKYCSLSLLEKIPYTPPHPSSHSTGMIVIIGGVYQLYNGTVWNNIWADMTDTPSYDTSNGTWRKNTAKGTTIPPSRILHTTTLCRGSLHYCILFYLALTTILTSSILPSSHSTLATDGYSLIIHAGSSPAPVNGVIPSILPTSGGSELTLGDVWVLDTNTYIWSSPKLTGFAPSNRFGHTAVQVGTQMIVMGGSIGQNYTADLSSDTAVLNTSQWTWLTTYTPPTVWPDVFNTTKPSPSNTAIPADSNPPGLGTGAITGIAIGTIAVLGIAGAFFFVCRRRQLKLAHMTQGSQHVDVAPPYGSDSNMNQYATGGQYAAGGHGNAYTGASPFYGSLASEHNIVANAQPLTQPPYGQRDAYADQRPHAVPLSPKATNGSQVIELPNEQYDVPPLWMPSKPDQGDIGSTSMKPDDKRIEMETSKPDAR
ncbi:hypothetical protein BC936DRAFT_144756 [Jimgerdemannia flammicorona]|uniref:Galactose oxidase n=1 Tax=Jimgerdemannia flammicorona TaxID=994334 RepID=A0A433DBQ6_9FUNG|nr:hypothetical protein BC936DRAFT_144756 [Jimgerdemannia flammicorona]